MECVVNDNGESQCPPDFAPEINSDVSGIGVRISFYLQALFLAWLTVRGRSLEEITGALYTLIVTNLAMAVTSLILGFKENPSLTFHDSLIVFYLLALSWASVFFTLPTYNRFVKSDKVVQVLSVIQSYVLFAYAIAILSNARTFGPLSCCNETAKVVLFRPFSALGAGRVVGWVIVLIVVVAYTIMCIYDYWPLVKRWYGLLKQRIPKRYNRSKTKDDLEGGIELDQRGESTGSAGRPPLDSGTGLAGARQRESTGQRPHRRRKKQERHRTAGNSHIPDPGYDIGLAGNSIVPMIVISIIWALMVMNTELLIRWNNFQGSTEWQFGQILPMFLVVLPLSNSIKTFASLGIRRRQHKRKRNRHQGPKTAQIPTFYPDTILRNENPYNGDTSARISEHSIHSPSSQSLSLEEQTDGGITQSAASVHTSSDQSVRSDGHKTDATEEHPAPADTTALQMLPTEQDVTMANQTSEPAQPPLPSNEVTVSRVEADTLRDKETGPPTTGCVEVSTPPATH